jgi:hypothetical protein
MTIYVDSQIINSYYILLSRERWFGCEYRWHTEHAISLGYTDNNEKTVQRVYVFVGYKLAHGCEHFGVSLKGGIFFGGIRRSRSTVKRPCDFVNLKIRRISFLDSVSRKCS